MTTKITKSNKVFEDEAIFTQAFSSRSYSASTENIEVSVWPEFLDSKSSVIGDLFVWAYHVRIDNRSDKSVQLISR